MNECLYCKERKPWDEFPRNKRMKSGHLNECKACRSTRMKAAYKENPERFKKHQRDWRQKNPELNAQRVRKSFLKRKYGITEADYLRMLEEQDGLCAICRTDKPRGRYEEHFHVDHDHETNVVRGLLCYRCNTAIGLLGDSVQVLESAVAYLSRQTIVRFDGDD